MARYSVWIAQIAGMKHTRCVCEVAESLVEALRTLGHEVRGPEPSTSYFVTNPTPYADGKLGRAIILAANLIPDIPLPEDAILYNLEPVYLNGWFADEWQKSAYLRILRRHTVWDYTESNALKLRTYGVPRVINCPVGYTPCLERIKPAPVQDIDVLHYGSLSVHEGDDCNRRADILNALDDVQIVDETGKLRPLRVEHLFGVYGEDRDRYIARAKLVINVHPWKTWPWEVVRCSYLMANHVCVVSENEGDDPGLDALGRRGTAFVPYEKIVETCRGLLDARGGVVLSDEMVPAAEARAKIAAAGYEAIKAIDFTANVKAALEQST